MAIRVEYQADNGNGLGEAGGSDGRLNVSSRADRRGYYNSRDNSESYVMIFDDAQATDGDYIAYLKNTKSDGKHLVVEHIGLNCEGTYGVFKMCTVDASVTPSGGTAVTPTLLNRGGKANSATVEALAPTDSNATPMTISSVGACLDIASTSGAYGHQEFRLADQVRLGENQAIAISIDATSEADMRTFGAIFFYFE